MRSFLGSTESLRRLAELYRKPQRSTGEEEEIRSLSARLVRTSAPLALEVWNVLEENRLAEAEAPYRARDESGKLKSKLGLA